MKLIVQLLVGWSLGHMLLTNPPPRKFQFFKNGVGQNQDYTIQGPLEDYRTFPCQGKKPGPVTRTYRAGSYITATIGGEKAGEHGGGHCQFSLTYNEKQFVVLKTVIGNCIKAAKSYRIKLPRNLANGRVTFAWTWVNHLGRREFYMNCADIRIVGGKPGSALRGKNILVAHIKVPGRRIYHFPQLDFFRNAKKYYSRQPKVTIRPPR
ncbi:hypothetical protein DSO57_1009955 [Entomophthora muscae]|uniref:Uncharacterized protein n=2 Tax=Entomophthora muscae TaxID=34485 RepID=A0ACC2UHH7_9FUNG|nr:hypothetical protein DSO57_1022044 [Entomophthora muscae]KAJ9085847.1 hypothetical protein DSO57_1009955 [Entomophthora muscae]